MKIKTKMLSAALLLAVSASSFAQHEVGRFSIIPRLGVSLANLTNNDMYYVPSANNLSKLKSRNKAGLLIGADIDYQALPCLSVSAGVYYSMQGARYSDYQEAGATDKQFVGNSDNHIDMQYINVPLMANLYVSQGLAFKLGVQAGFLLDAQNKSEVTDITIKDENEKEYGRPQKLKADMDCNSFDISIPVGISYEYMNVILDARYNIGLSNIYKIDEFKSKNKFFTFTVGYRFGL